MSEETQENSVEELEVEQISNDNETSQEFDIEDELKIPFWAQKPKSTKRFVYPTNQGWMASKPIGRDECLKSIRGLKDKLDELGIEYDELPQVDEEIESVEVVKAVAESFNQEVDIPDDNSEDITPVVLNDTQNENVPEDSADESEGFEDDDSNSEKRTVDLSVVEVKEVDEVATEESIIATKKAATNAKRAATRKRNQEEKAALEAESKKAHEEA